MTGRLDTVAALLVLLLLVGLLPNVVWVVAAGTAAALVVAAGPAASSLWPPLRRWMVLRLPAATVLVLLPPDGPPLAIPWLVRAVLFVLLASLLLPQEPKPQDAEARRRGLRAHLPFVLALSAVAAVPLAAWLVILAAPSPAAASFELLFAGALLVMAALLAALGAAYATVRSALAGEASG